MLPRPCPEDPPMPAACLQRLDSCHVHAFELDDQRVVRAAMTRSSVGVVAPTWPNSSRWAILASR